MQRKVLLILLILVVIGLLSFAGFKKVFKSPTLKRQAVFMTNGQVYFGYIANPNSQMVTIKDVYYLKTQDLLASSDQNKKKILLIKLGNELHQPENVMYINRDQILFYQNMQDSSQINDAIAKFTQKSTTNPQDSPSPQPSSSTSQ